MGVHDSVPEEPLAYTGVAQVSDEIREQMAALVAGLVADGFTDREARSIVTSYLAMAASQVKTDG